MKVIKKIRVVEQHSRDDFNASLVNAVNLLQGEGLQTMINNPHTIVNANDEMIYIAVVEGSTNINPEFLGKKK